MNYVGSPTLAAYLGLSEGYRRHVSSGMLQDQAVAVYPAPYAGDSLIMSSHAPHLWFCEELVDALTPWHEETTKAAGSDPHTPPGSSYLGSPESLLAVSGYLMKPTVYPMLRNYLTERVDRLSTMEELKASRLFADHKLSKTEAEAFAHMRHWMSDHHRALFIAVCSAYTEKWVKGKTWIALGASTGFWTFTRDREVRDATIRDAARIIKAFAKSEANGKVTLFCAGGGIVAAKATRSQAEVPGKERWFQSFDLTEVKADKDIYPDGATFPSASMSMLAESTYRPTRAKRRRQRHANATSAAATGGEQILFQGFDRHALVEYAFTWKHTWKGDLDKKLNPWKYATLIDYAQFDSQNSACFATVFNSTVLSRLRGEGRDGFERLFSLWDSPAFIRAEYHLPPRQRKWTILGDPFSLGPSGLYVGQLSGLPRNPRFNKCSGTAQSAMILDLALVLESMYEAVSDGHGLDDSACWALALKTLQARIEHDRLEPRVGENRLLPSEIPDLLRGKDKRFAILNAGDDCVLLSNELSLKAAIDMAASLNPYMISEVDRFGRFLGYNICTEGGKLVSVPSLMSMATNYFMPEFAFGDPIHRADAGIGFDQRIILHYGWHPEAAMMLRLQEEKWKLAFHAGAELRTTVGRWRRRTEFPDYAGSALSQIAALWPHGVYTGRQSFEDLPDDYLAKHFIGYDETEDCITEFYPWIEPSIMVDAPLIARVGSWDSPPFEFPRTSFLGL